MILLHRITPFFVALAAGLGFVAMLTLARPLVSAVLALAVVAVLLSRLLSWQVKSLRFWNLFGTPFLFLASSYGFLLLLETQAYQVAIAVLSSLLVFFFLEHVFHYTHLPANYQPYSIEHLSSVLHLITIFFVSALGFASSILLQSPLLLLSGIFFVISVLVLYGTLWTSKVEHGRALPYALAGSVLTTEIFSVITFLPTGMYTNAAILVTFLYLFIGLTRAHFLDSLTRPVLRRYVAIGSVLMAAIAGTAQWA